MTTIAISLYEALDTDKYVGVAGPATFSFTDYLLTGAELGIKAMRAFADLNYFWDSSKGKPVFKPENAILPYNYKVAEKTYDYDGPINPSWWARIDQMVKVGRANRMQFLVCGATQGPDYGSPFFSSMGYPKSDDYYDRANFPNFVASGAWGRLCKYWTDIKGELDPYTARFKVYEAYNEGDPGMEELKQARPKHQMFQLDMPRPIPAGVKVNALRSLGVKRFAFHGVYTPKDLDAIVADCATFGIKKEEISAETDGATPWYLGDGKYKYTTESHQAHYKDRINWNKSAANKKAVIDAHVLIAERAKQLGIAWMGFQSVLKWSQLLVWTPDAKEWATAILEV
jgi:diadenosine tetraphosphatase ApaH/serine/threonine PP2A family protein phosphatase